MGGTKKESRSTVPAPILVPRLLNECQHSEASHFRAIKELVACRRNDFDEFVKTWLRHLQPVFLVIKRERTVERILNFAVAFTVYWDEENFKECDDFVVKILWTLLDWTEAADKAVRFRACQMISEVIAKLDHHHCVDEELWEKMTLCMQTRMRDRLMSVRVFAASALSRLVLTDDIENGVTVRAYRNALKFDNSAEVRRMVVMSIPATNATVPDVVERVADVSESVRKAAYRTICERFSLTGLSIMQRALVLERGLSERIPAVRAECENLLELWLREDCDGDPLILLRYLDVETYEKVGENVMLELLRKDAIKASDAGLKQFIGSAGTQPRLMDAEEALYWRMLCNFLRSQAEAKGRDAATAGGAEAVVNAAAAQEKNQYLENILPSTVADFVLLVEAHLSEEAVSKLGSAARFAARQLLLLAESLDFADSTSRKDAGLLLQRLLREEVPLEEQNNSDNNESQVWVGDGISLGGDESWANAVARFALEVHAAPNEFEEVVAASVAEIAKPCREGGANVRQWLHCLAVTGLLLENIKSLAALSTRAIEPEEIFRSLLLPAVKHLHLEVQQAGVRCLGIFCGLEKSPSSQGVEQLRLCLQSSRSCVRKMAMKALFDLILRHGAAAIDQAFGTKPDLGLPTPHARPPGLEIGHKVIDRTRSKSQLPLLELLSEELDSEIIVEDEPSGTAYPHSEISETNIPAEGFVKVLLHNRRFPEVRLMQEGLVKKLMALYFSDSTKQSPRLRQLLSVFFQAWCSLSEDNKRCIAKIFIPIMRNHWPGIGMTPEKAGTVLVERRRAAQVAHFMLHLLQLPLISKTRQGEKKGTADCNDGTAASLDDALDEGHEMLAILICYEVKGHSRMYKSLNTARKTYTTMLCQVATLLKLRSSQQEEIKALLVLLPRLIDWLPTVGMVTVKKELTDMLARLKKLDRSPDKGLTDEELELFMLRMGLQDICKEESSPEVPSTPTPLSVTRTGGRRRVSIVAPPNSAIAETHIRPNTRSLRKRTESQTARTQSVVEARMTTRRNLVSDYDSTEFDLSSSSPSSDSESDFEPEEV